ncbi:ESX secretion-associated protein EspG [Actinoalloteichus hymeniacidonis]|uniref:EspG family n=1 Tax=Actinoalloteichus hymeniacidonis TaxID=340345 RepID=A0AAC9HVI0_9PSEU|nr:ESX secretion-associated protein EspG [Actinoalloteichus hymeniacidonis]AOS66173.1 EspG family [Actinoalloteichus hymeniacidonis]MBB5905724.1 hypothetical protein [Actinoalloteichus hymeniacidonis]
MAVNSSPVVDRAIELSVVEFDVCWEAARLGERPVQLRGPSPGRTAEERRRIVHEAMNGLQRRELASAGRPSDELTELLTMLKHHRWSVDAWLWLARPVSAIVCVAGREAVLAALDGATVRLQALPDYRAITGLVRLAGSAKPGVGDSTSLRADLLLRINKEADGDLHFLAERLIAAGERPATVRSFLRMIDGAGTHGRFAAGKVDANGRRRYGDRAVVFHDTPSGRHLQLHTGSGSDAWITVLPADEAKVIAAVRELVDEL